MGTWVHGYDIADFTRDLLHALYNSTDGTDKANLSVKYVSVRKLDQQYINTTSNVYPIIFIHIPDPVSQDVENFTAIDSEYRIRVLYGRQFASDEDVGKTLYQAIERIANALQDAQDKFHGRADSGNLSLTAGTVYNMRLDGMEYEPPENAAAAELGQNLVFAAVSFNIEVEATGS